MNSGVVVGVGVGVAGVGFGAGVVDGQDGVA